MRIRNATPKEVSYACRHFHYAKSVPAAYKYAYSVFNDDGEWCGVVLYSYGSNPQIGKQYGLFAGEILELIRVALNGRQGCTSQAVAATLRRLHKENPQVRMLVSFADQEQGHLGTIYQAMNWMYVGEAEGSRHYIVNGKKLHYKSVLQHGWKDHEKWLSEHVDPDAKKISGVNKHKYLYFFDKRLRKRLAYLERPYPKGV